MASLTYPSSIVTFINVVRRQQVKYADFRRKRMNTNPKRGPYHYRSPARIFWRTVSNDYN